jgi:hypothetical protein
MKKERNHESMALGICRQLSQHEVHALTLIVNGDDGQWTKTLDLNLRPNAAAQFMIFELPGEVVKPSGEMRKLNDTHSQFAVRVSGSSTPTCVIDLAGAPPCDWMVKMFQTFARCRAAIALLVTFGRVSVTLHEGDQL